MGILTQECGDLAHLKSELEEELRFKRAKLDQLDRENREFSEQLRNCKQSDDVARQEMDSMVSTMEVLEKKEKKQRELLAETKARLDLTEKDMADLLLEKTRLETLERNVVAAQETFERRLKEDMVVARRDVEGATQGQLEVRDRRITEAEEQLGRARAEVGELQVK